MGCGIATGTSFRRLVEKSLARRRSGESLRPFHPVRAVYTGRHGLCWTRDTSGNRSRSLGHGVVHVWELTTMFCAAQCWARSSRWNRGLLPFVRATYAQPSCYHWQDEHGRVRQIRQHEGGEQGDPLLPLLFCEAVHNRTYLRVLG